MFFTKRTSSWLCATLLLLFGAQVEAQSDVGHDVVSSPGTVAQTGGQVDTSDPGEAAGGDDVAASPEMGGEIGGELASEDGVEEGVEGEFDAGEIEFASEILFGEGGEVSADEMAEHFADVQAVFEDAELFSEAEYAEFQSLPAMETLEFGEAPETVCGKDNRIRIKNTTRFPWRMNCQLIITLANGRRSRCTGWLVGRRTVMTAGHCVYSKANGGWAKSITVVPGMNGRLKPFGSARSTRLFSVKGWVNSSSPNYDYGAIHINKPFGRWLGTYGFAALSSRTLKGLMVNLAGYSADKPFGTQWYHWGRIVRVTARRIFYYIDTYGGASGSAVYWIRKGRRYAVGIHAYGGCPNGGTRITRPVFDNIRRWKR